jgi:hypothetical protein
MKLTLTPVLLVGAALLPTMCLADGYCVGHKYAVVKESASQYFTMKGDDKHCANVNTNHPDHYKNMCTSGHWSCSPPPVHVTKAFVGGKGYSCTTKVPSGVRVWGGSRWMLLLA